MIISDRVGVPDEDETMVEARPNLHQINRRGRVTTDSQMGKDEVLPGRSFRVFS